MTASTTPPARTDSQPASQRDAHAEARIALSCLDLTSLNATDDTATIDALCQRAITPWGAVAAVCVWPRFVAQARAALPASVKVAAVANFPAGALDEALALRDAHAIADAGGDEVDLVLPWHALLAGQAAAAAAVVAAVRKAVPQVTLKLIIESGELGSLDAIRAASLIGLDAGADFIKTSTGKTPRSASPEAAREIVGAIATHARRDVAGFKASGGIRTLADARAYLDIVAQGLGHAALVPQRLRFGASGLLDDLVRVLSSPQSGPTETAPTPGKGTGDAAY